MKWMRMSAFSGRQWPGNPYDSLNFASTVLNFTAPQVPLPDDLVVLK
jgi:hypothetical protein